MEERTYMELYEKMFDSFQEQVRIYMLMVVGKNKKNEGVSVELFDTFKKHLVNTLDTLAISLKNIKDEKFINFYKTKIEYNYTYIDTLTSVISQEQHAKK